MTFAARHKMVKSYRRCRGWLFKNQNEIEGLVVVVGTMAASMFLTWQFIERFINE
jgi:hypothetical protein